MTIVGGEIVTTIERSSMKKTTLPAIFLAFMASSCYSYGSLLLEENATSKTTNSSKLTENFLDLPLVTGTQNKFANDIQSELEHLQSGIIFLSSGKISLATKSFQEAIEYGSPLGYLYAGALEKKQSLTRMRYLYLADSFAKDNIIPSETYKLHRNALTKQGFIDFKEWRIKTIQKA